MKTKICLVLFVLTVALIMLGCPTELSVADIRIYNNSSEAYKVRLFKVEGGKFLNFETIQSKQMSEEKHIDAGKYYVYWRPASQTGDDWPNSVERYYNNGDDKTETISATGSLQ